MSRHVQTLETFFEKQKSYLKDTTDFINFIENIEESQNAILVSMAVTSLYTNILQDEGITIVCEAYDRYHNNSPSIPSHYLKVAEHSFQEPMPNSP